MKKSDFYKEILENKISQWPLDFIEAIEILTRKYPMFSTKEIAEKLNRDQVIIVAILDRLNKSN